MAECIQARTGSDWDALPASIILVVAFDVDLRRSIEFALEAEGYVVNSHARLFEATTSPTVSAAACMVVDEDSLQDLEDWRLFCRLTKPTVLLADKSQRPGGTDAACIIFKPLLGNALVETVRHVVRLAVIRNFP
jgi:DNA-binding response OmpR family regulator